MKINLTRHLLAPFLAAALPCVAFGQAGSSPTASAQKDRAAPAPSPSAIDSSRETKGAMQLVTKGDLDSKMTAKTLIGADVHGADGNKIGSVVDIVLASSLNVGTRSIQAASKGSYENPTARTEKAIADQSSGIGTSPTAASTEYAAQPSGTKVAPDARQPGTSRNDRYSSTVGGDQMQPAVVISTGGVFGVGSDLIQVPFSKINYDSDKKEVRLNVSEPEWQALRDGIARSGVTSAR